jgi:hypothetical protein
MKKIRASAAAASAAAILGAGAFVLPALASPAAASHTLKFISVTKKSITLTKTTGAQQDTDVSSTGKTVGFDMLYFSATSASSAALNITLDTKGGFLYGTAKVSFKTGAITGGKVTGGTGTFKGATGTIKARNLNQAGTRTAVTITYRT